MITMESLQFTGFMDEEKMWKNCELRDSRKWPSSVEGFEKITPL